MKKSLIATTLTTALAMTLVFGIAGTDPVQAGPRGGMHGGASHGGPMGMLNVFMRLDLTEDQRAAIRAILEEFRPQIVESRSLIRELTVTLKQTVRDSGFNEALVTPIAQSIGAATTEAALVRAEMDAELLAVLTPEQAELLDSILEDRADRPAGFSGRGR